MRTKIFLLTAALSAAGVATSMAQTVYSVNAVGYVNIDVPPKFSLIANPLDTTNNTVLALFPGVPDGTTIYKFTPGTGFAISSFTVGEWDIPGMTLNPGEGAFILNPSLTTPFKVTFVGEVKQGNLSNPIPAGFSIRASQVPQAGPLDGTLKGELAFPVVEGDTIYRFNKTTQKYVIHAFTVGEWEALPGGASGRPIIEVGESFFVNKIAAAAWTRNFSVNTP